MRVPAILALILAASGAVAQSSAMAQPDIDTDIALLRSDLQAQRTDIVAHTMQLTDAQAKLFWPLYREYSNRQQAIGDQRVNLIKDYAAQYDSMDDAKAEMLMNRWLNYDDAKAKLRSEYYPQFRNAIGAKQAVKFFQIDQRLNLIVDLKLSSEIPIVQ
jgi:Spy/CpxP family protein refolding chaperone